MKLRFVDDDEKPIMWTVIFGENGTGKSTILRSIVLLLSSRKRLEDLMKVSNPIREGTPSGRGTVTIMLDETSKRLEKFLELGWIFNNTKDRIPNVMEPAGGNDKIFLEGEKDSFFFCAYGETRLPSAKPYRGSQWDDSDPENENVISLFNEGVALKPVDKGIMNIRHHFLEGNEKYQSAMKALLNILPSAPPFIEMSQREEALFKTPNGNLAVGQLSSGYRDVVCLLVDIITRLFEKFPESKDPLKESGIVLIDEISLHLHPRWQKVVIGNLRKHLPNIQFIVTSHSPLVAQSLKENEVVTLKQSGIGRNRIIEVKRHEFSPKGMSADQLLTSSIFGLESAKSLEVEALRRKFRKLRKLILKEVASEKQEEEYQRVVDELKRVGEAPGDTDLLRRLNLAFQDALSDIGDSDLVERPSLEELKKLADEMKD